MRLLLYVLSHVARINPLSFAAIPLDNIVEFDPGPAKYVQCTSYGQVHFAGAQFLNLIQVGQTSSTTSIRNGNAAPISKTLDQLFINTPLESFIVGGMDQELGAVRFQKRYRL